MIDAEKRRELPCANCDRTGTLREEVRVEATGTRKGTPYRSDAGKVKVSYGWVEDTEGEEIIGTDDIYCSACGTTFASWEEATADLVYEHRCTVCGWWGVQVWLHDTACPGELEKRRLPRYDPAQLEAAA